MQPATLFAALSHTAVQQQWQYVYPVLSRRAQGISLGINLHPNHACNWQCIYCQVSGMHRVHSPTIRIAQLINELQTCLQSIAKYTQNNSRLTDHSPACQNTLNSAHNHVSDIAFAGDGEPTSSPQFAEAMEAVATLLHDYPIPDRPQTIRVITNGSQLHHGHVQHALRRLAALGGEVWFKLDAGTDQEMFEINQARLAVALHVQRLKTSCQCCRTWVQTAVLTRKTDQGLVSTPSLRPYLALLDTVKTEIAGILLYGIARPSQQAAGKDIAPVSISLLDEYAAALRNMGHEVQVFA